MGFKKITKAFCFNARSRPTSSGAGPRAVRLVHARGRRAVALGRPIIPHHEMIEACWAPPWASRPTSTPAVGLLFAGRQDPRLIDGPLFVGQDYELEREIIALSESARTESVWVRTRVFEAGSRKLAAERS